MAVLKYLILSKVLNNGAGEVPALLGSKMAVKHTGIHLEAMAAVARAAKSRSLGDFDEVVSKLSRAAGCVVGWLVDVLE